MRLFGRMEKPRSTGAGGGAGSSLAAVDHFAKRKLGKEARWSIQLVDIEMDYEIEASTSLLLNVIIFCNIRL